MDLKSHFIKINCSISDEALYCIVEKKGKKLIPIVKKVKRKFIEMNSSIPTFP